MFRDHSFSCGNFTVQGSAGPASGPPIVFLHGVTRCWQDFLTLMPAVTPRWTAYAIDFRGHGLSDRGSRYLLIDHIADVRDFLTAHFHEPVAIYGHSLGALVAAGIAAEMPDRVRAVILEDPPAEPLLRNIRSSVFHTLFQLLRSFAGQQRSIPELTKELGGYLMPLPSGSSARMNQIRDVVSIRFMAKCLRLCDPEVLTPLIESRWLDGYDMEAVFKAVRCPTLLFRADEKMGGMLSSSEGERLLRSLADGTLIEWPGTGHLIHWMQPEMTAKLTVGFLESL